MPSAAKHVFAHFMVGNTYPYTPREWEQDLIDCSERAGLDGFVLNVGREDWQRERVLDCFATAAAIQSPLKFILSFDMRQARDFQHHPSHTLLIHPPPLLPRMHTNPPTFPPPPLPPTLLPPSLPSSVIPAATPADADYLCGYLARLARHPSLFRVPGTPRVVVSTFAGQDATFGAAQLDEAWAGVKQRLAAHAQAPVCLIPAWFVDPARYPRMASMDGYFHWNGGWPLHLSPQSHRREIEGPALDSDVHHLRHLEGKLYMAAVSPWFFTHYGKDSWDKNWIYRGDDWLYVRRWEQILAMRDRIDIVQVISWNDYGESHYIAPVRGAQPSSQAWVDGFPHDAWLALTAHFARAFREGRAPPVARDTIFMWARPHPRDAAARADAVPRPDNWELTDDRFWVVVLAAAPARVRLSADVGEEEDAGRLGATEPAKSGRSLKSRFKATFGGRSDGGAGGSVNGAGVHDVPAGLTKLSLPLRPGRGMRAIMERDGAVVAKCAPAQFRFEASPEVYNFNAFVAQSE
ncbi:glycoside hydrolase family 71 protein [Schizophyllum fasciatum]